MIQIFLHFPYQSQPPEKINSHKKTNLSLSIHLRFFSVRISRSFTFSTCRIPIELPVNGIQIEFPFRSSRNRGCKSRRVLRFPAHLRVSRLSRMYVNLERCREFVVIGFVCSFYGFVDGISGGDLTLFLSLHCC